MCEGLVCVHASGCTQIRSLLGEPCIVTDATLKKLSLADIAAMQAAGQLHLAPDAPKVELPAAFWDHAKVVEREPRKSVHLRLYPEVYRYFQEAGEGHIKRMQDVLAAYVKAQKAMRRPLP